MRFSKWSLLLAVFVLASPISHASVVLPTSPSVTYGTANVSNPANVQITSKGAIINWQSFSIGSGGSVNFAFQNVDPGNVVLNRVTGSSASLINGAITSNGSVFLQNANGIIFGAGTRVTATNFFATTWRVSDSAFETFANGTTGAWQMPMTAGSGDITFNTGGNFNTAFAGVSNIVALMSRTITIAPGVAWVNQSSTPGSIALLAGTHGTISSDPTSGVTHFTIYTDGTNNISIGQKLQTNGFNIYGDNINIAGNLYSPSSADKEGRILVAATNNITVQPGVYVNTSSTTPGLVGGNIGLIAGNTLSIGAGANVKADGDASDAGTITLIGQNLAISPTSIIHANATLGGRNGTVAIIQESGNDITGEVENAKIAVRTKGDTMVMDNDGSGSLPPVLPESLKQDLERRVSANKTSNNNGNDVTNFGNTNKNNPASSGSTNGNQTGNNSTSNAPAVDKDK